MRNPKELSWRCILGYTFLNYPKFQNSFVWNYCWIFQRRFPNIWKERCLGFPCHNIRMGYGATAANQNLVLETGISEIQILLFVFWVLRAEKRLKRGLGKWFILPCTQDKFRRPIFDMRGDGVFLHLRRVSGVLWEEPWHQAPATKTNSVKQSIL